jgi:bifunctional non-homologous end joining protein LigD
MLVRMDRQRNKNYWLLIKERDAEARPGSGDAVVTANKDSIASSRDIAAVAAARDRVWQ